MCKKFLCFTFHNFYKWEKVDEGDMKTEDSIIPIPIHWIRQERICQGCGYTESKLSIIK